jgi:hypothetical protein
VELGVLVGAGVCRQSPAGSGSLHLSAGSVVGLIALFSSYDHVSPPPARYLAAVDAVGRRPKNERVQIEKGTERIEKRTGRIEKELALLNWMHSEIDLIEADLPSKRTTAANSSDC